MPTDWTTIVNSTTKKFLKEVEVNIMRERILLDRLERAGRFTFNDSGTELDWKVQYKRAPLTAFSDGGTISFVRRDRHKTANLGWRAYVITDMMSKLDRLKNRGPQAIVDYYSGIMEGWLEDDAFEQFCDELYANGVTSTSRIHGIESFMADGGAVTSPATSGYRAPSSTYAGLSCVKGTYGGTWTGTWPDGSGDPQYDFWSPLIANYTHTTAWGGSTHTWATHCTDVMRDVILNARKLKSKKGQMSLIIMTSSMYKDWLGTNDAKQQINITRGSGGEPGAVSLGFNTTWFDGCELAWEFGMPSATAYGFNVNQMQIRSMQSQLFEVEGPWFNEETQGHRFLVDFYGNARFNPRAFAKFGAYG